VALQYYYDLPVAPLLQVFLEEGRKAAVHILWGKNSSSGQPHYEDWKICYAPRTAFCCKRKHEYRIEPLRALKRKADGLFGILEVRTCRSPATERYKDSLSEQALAEGVIAAPQFSDANSLVHGIVSFENLHRASQGPKRNWGEKETLSKKTDTLVSKRLGFDDFVSLGNLVRGLVLGSKDGNGDLEVLGVLGVDQTWVNRTCGQEEGTQAAAGEGGDLIRFGHKPPCVLRSF
jgi:hypothetical protein